MASLAFARELLTTAVAQMCEKFGFESAQASALDTLTDVCEKYLDEVATVAQSYAEQAGRTEANVLDVGLAFEDVGLSSSELLTFIDIAGLPAFPKQVPSFPMKKQSRAGADNLEDPAPRPAHVPPFLPRFPDRHTYVRTPVYPDAPDDAPTVQKKRTKKMRQVESSLVRISEQFPEQMKTVNYAAKQGKRSARLKNVSNLSVTNPFLQPPKTREAGNGDVAVPPAHPGSGPAVPVSMARFEDTDSFLPPGNKSRIKVQQSSSAVTKDLASQQERKKRKIESILGLDHGSGRVETLHGNAVDDGDGDDDDAPPAPSSASATAAPASGSG